MGVPFASRIRTLMPTDNDTTRTDFLLAQADQCVKCGLCLPHCPTYRETLDENESPRGRIALMQGLALGLLEPTRRLRAHLDSCLTCRACESACPAKVRYGNLIDTAREELAQYPTARTGLARIARQGVQRRWLRRTLAWLVFGYQRSGLGRVARYSGLLRLLRLNRLEGLAWPLERPTSLHPVYHPQGACRGRVALFTGCIAETFDRRALSAAIKVLNRLGYEVVVPPEQGCCGALSSHAGDVAAARRLAEQNLAAFSDPDLDAIVYLASGCGVNLVEYDRVIADSGGELAPFRSRLREVSAFIDSHHWPDELAPKPLQATVAVHEPCTLRNTLKGSKAAHEMLSRIPQLKVIPLPGNESCCGAAGSYMLTQPRMADRLREHKLQAVDAETPDYLVTSNIGCAMHLAAGLRSRKPQLCVLHPIELLAQQMD